MRFANRPQVTLLPQENHFLDGVVSQPRAVSSRDFMLLASISYPTKQDSRLLKNHSYALFGFLSLKQIFTTEFGF